MLADTVAGLESEKQAQETRIAELESENQEQETRIAELESENERLASEIATADDVAEQDETVDEAETEVTEVALAEDESIVDVKNYVGMNLATVGYTSLGGDRLDRYESATVALQFVTVSGEYIDIENDDELQTYVVVSQNVEPGKKIKLIHKKDSDGKPYSNLYEFQSIETIDLLVKKVGEPDPENAYSARTAHPFQRNGAPFRFKLSKAQQVN